MRASILRSLLLGGFTAGALAAAPSAQALTINLHDIGGVTGSKAEFGFKAAAKYWESVLTNDATVNINVGFSDLGPNVLGSTGSSLATYVPIDSYYGALAATGTSALDAQAVANLSPTNGNGGVKVIVPGYLTGIDGVNPTTKRIAPDGPINSTMALSTANLKAFGVDLGPGYVDAEIQFSSTFAFDFTPQNGIAPKTYDFIGVAVHEIGHALGFLSGVDDFDYSGYSTGPVDDYWWGYALDMFRYSQNGGDPTLDWSVGADSYLSIDGGKTPLFDGYFSTGTNYGDGWQASHWKEPSGPPCENFRGIMNPYICGGVTDGVTALDLAALDAIGWNLNLDVLKQSGYYRSTADIFGAAVPEPADWALVMLGFGLVGGMVRRRPLVAA